MCFVCVCVRVCVVSVCVCLVCVCVCVCVCDSFFLIYFVYPSQQPVKKTIKRMFKLLLILTSCTKMQMNMNT